MIKIVLPGEPIRRVSPTFSKFKTFDSQKHLLHAAKFQVLDQVGRNPSMPFSKDVAIQLEFNYYFEIPKGKENLFHWGLLDMIEAPDYDNCAKFLGDVIKKIVFDDDRQINIATITKEYSENPRTEIKIMPKKPKCSDQVKEVLSFVSPEHFAELAYAMVHIADWCNKSEESGYIEKPDYEEAAYLILEFADKHAETLKKINKKFPGLAKVLKEKLENK